MSLPEEEIDRVLAEALAQPLSEAEFEEVVENVQFIEQLSELLRGCPLEMEEPVTSAPVEAGAR